MLIYGHLVPEKEFIEIPPKLEEDLGEKVCVAVGVVLRVRSRKAVPVEKCVEAVSAALRRDGLCEHKRIDDDADVFESGSARMSHLQFAIEPEQVHSSVVNHDDLAADGVKQVVGMGAEFAAVLEFAVLDAVDASCGRGGTAVRIASEVKAADDRLLGVGLNKRHFDEASEPAAGRFRIKKDEGFGFVKERINSLEPCAALGFADKNVRIEEGAEFCRHEARKCAAARVGRKRCKKTCHFRGNGGKGWDDAGPSIRAVEESAGGEAGGRVGRGDGHGGIHRD